MATISGTEKRKTFTCSKCGCFLWTEGLCGPCEGFPSEAEVEEDNKVTYKHDPAKGKVTARKRK